MSPLVHGLLAWLVAWVALDRVTDRRLVVIAGVAADLDGVFVLFDPLLFTTHHHTFGHSFVFGLPVVLVAALLADRRWRTGLAALGAFSLHLLADVVSSGWAVQPLYPLSSWSVTAGGVIPEAAMYLVIVPGVAILAMAATAYVMYRHETSPVEFLSVRLDRQFVDACVYPFKHRCRTCGKRAAGRCVSCGDPVCSKHVTGYWRPRCPRPECAAAR